MSFYLISPMTVNNGYELSSLPPVGSRVCVIDSRLDQPTTEIRYTNRRPKFYAPGTTISLDSCGHSRSRPRECHVLKWVPLLYRILTLNAIVRVNVGVRGKEKGVG